MRVKMLEEIPGLKTPPGIISTSTERAIALTLAGAGEPVDPGPMFLREIERRKNLSKSVTLRPDFEPEPETDPEIYKKGAASKSQTKKRKKKK